MRRQGFWDGNYGGGVRVGRPFGARRLAPLKGASLSHTRSTRLGFAVRVPDSESDHRTQLDTMSLVDRDRARSESGGSPGARTP